MVTNTTISPKPIVTRVASLFDVSDRSLVMLRGYDALDLLQRLSTNNVSKLGVGGVLQTILTNEKGRMIDVLSVLKTNTKKLLLVGQTKSGVELQQWLEKYIIMENAATVNATSEYVHYLIYNVTSKMGNPKWLPAESKHFHSLFDQGDKANTAIYSEKWNNTTLYHVLSPRTNAAATLELLQNHDCALKDSQAFEIFRVEKALPAYPNELSSLYNPMEVGLIEFISFTKGCYIGQEVIARLDTYKKVQRRLVQLELGVQPDQVPISIRDEKEEVGTITSVSPDNPTGHNLALGYLRTSNIEKQTPLFFFKNSKRISVKLRV